ncbi:MAG TPA: hypothetical protein PLZ75_06650 [Bacteroidales bacterium]|jgi:hypothetical protein|nr:hypothetical protein [Bacteroidales bacterium]HQH24799.1 hypothetical protein [Bacteroidales bacterium]
MDLFFNEISAYYPAKSKFDAQQKMSAFLELCKKAKQEGFNSCKVVNNFEETELAATYTIHNWLGDTEINKNQKDFYFSFRNSPYEKGIEHTFDAFCYLDEPTEPNYNGSIVEGLMWANLCDSFALSFPVNEVWRKSLINIEFDDKPDRRKDNVKHISSLLHFDYYQEFIKSQKEPVLVPSDINPSEKRIHLSDDHGKDKLYALAKKLVNCDYVIEIPHSLPFDRHGRSFIREIHPNGRIDVTLIEEDDGYSMMVQTTGKTLWETQEIAKILKELY